QGIEVFNLGGHILYEELGCAGLGRGNAWRRVGDSSSIGVFSRAIGLGSLFGDCGCSNVFQAGCSSFKSEQDSRQRRIDMARRADECHDYGDGCAGQEKTYRLIRVVRLCMPVLLVAIVMDARGMFRCCDAAISGSEV